MGLSYSRFFRKAVALNFFYPFGLWLGIFVLTMPAARLHAEDDAGVLVAPAPLAFPLERPLAPPPPPPWAQGRPESMLSAALAPYPPSSGQSVAGKLDRLKLPPGFIIQLWAEGLTGARSMTLGANNTLFVGSRDAGVVYTVTEKEGQRVVKKLLTGLDRPTGVVFAEGRLYVAQQQSILKYEKIEDSLETPPAPSVLFDALPPEQFGPGKYLAMGPDGNLYLGLGADCNICVPLDTQAQIVRINPQTGVLETVAKGVRQSVGLTFHPLSKELWFSQLSRDWMGDDVPADTLHRVNRKGAHMGYPYCHQGEILDPVYGKGRGCGEFVAPTVKFEAHASPMGLSFYTGKMFPPDYKNRLIVAMHGSWNRTQKAGFNLMQLSFDATGKLIRWEPFVEGWLEAEQFWGRPTDLLVMPDGALLVSDDYAGVIYKISYKR